MVDRGIKALLELTAYANMLNFDQDRLTDAVQRMQS